MTITRFSARMGLVASLLVLHAAMPAAQAPAVPNVATPAQAPAQRPTFDRVVLTAGRSTVVPTGFDITRIAITNPEVADAVVVQPREILIDGKKGGTVSPRV